MKWVHFEMTWKHLEQIECVDRLNARIFECPQVSITGANPQLGAFS